VSSELAGQSAVVVGGASGIGAGIVRALVARGASVDIADRDIDGSQALADTLNAAGAEVTASFVDITKSETLDSFARDVRGRRAEIGLLFANAGALALKPFVEATEEDWRWLLDTNVVGTANTVRAFLPDLLNQTRRSRVAITSSISILRSPDMIGQSLYVASKAAQFGMCTALEAELADTNVALSIIFPGPVKTSLGAKSIVARPESVQLSVPVSASLGMISGDEAGERIILDILAGRRFITTHPDEKSRVASKFAEIMQAFDPLRGAGCEVEGAIQ